jgi:hypothetical protein
LHDIKPSCFFEPPAHRTLFSRDFLSSFQPWRFVMRLLIGLLLLSAAAYAQQDADPSSSSPMAAPPAARTTPREIDRQVTIPAGTHVPVSLRNAISTKSSHAGDQVYAQTTFPVVINDHIVIPAGTYVQGKISSIKPAGRIKGSAEVLMHFTSLIYPSGYTVMLPGSIESAPGVDNSEVKDKEERSKPTATPGKLQRPSANPQQRAR